jgi:hypothetical protein
MNVRIGMIFITEFLPYSPVPVCTKAISPTIPNAKKKPGDGSKRHGYQMQLLGLWKNPSDYIEHGKNCVKNKEENIEKRVPHFAEINRQMKLMKIKLNKKINYWLIR